MSTTVASPKTSQIAKSTRFAPSYRKGDVWMISSDPENPVVGTEIWSNRPAVIVSGDVANNRAGCMQIVYLSTSTIKRASPTHVVVPAPAGSGDALALCEQVHAVDASRLKRRLGYVPGYKIKEIDEAISLNLSLGKKPDSFSAFKKWEAYIKEFGIDMKASIEAHSGRCTDERVQALTRALELITADRDAYRHLYESSQQLDSALKDVAEALGQKV